MKKQILRVFLFLFFIGLSWACGIADAFVADEIDSIKDPKERARAWQVECFYQEPGRYPTEEEKAELFKEPGEEKIPGTTDSKKNPAKKKLPHLLIRASNQKYPPRRKQPRHLFLIL